MKKITQVLAVAGLALSLASASAVQIQIVETPTTPGTYTGTFDIAALGYNPALHVIDSARADFSFQGTGAEVSSDLYQLGVKWLGFSGWSVMQKGYGGYMGGGGGGPLPAALLADLADDGLLDFEWELIGQRFSSFTGTLTVNYSDKPAVPEGGMTAGLLGFALLGIGALRRKL
ncbi:MAG TPA: hypothetical protein PLT00_02535 [Verrucomicrobiota bacterium]|nr:MAG: hypothetical protein BWX84_03172 [Verrucomicrobia bacterium ADurb.Bin118]HPY29602.1 hypothetical protein [Verrucomicrobiota bacterium]HQB15571.1 hypothetical protein [Verrucomicrobiota bacterium]